MVRRLVSSMKRAATTALCLAALAILPGSIWAKDVVRTVDGEALEGSIAAETSLGVAIRTSDGLTRFVAKKALASVEREEVDPLVREEFGILKTMCKNTVRGWYELAFYAREHGLSSEASACFEKTLTFNSDHRGARRELGFRWIGHRWVPAAEFAKTGGEERELQVRRAWAPPGEERAARLKRLKKLGKWKVAFPSKYYDIYSNGTRAKVEKLAPDIDLMCEEYKRIFEYQQDITRPFPIHLYKNKQELMKATGAGSDKGGYYDGQKIVAFHGRLGGVLDTRAVLFHEGTHQFEALVLGEHASNIKPWLSEGLAVYYEGSRVAGDELKTGVIPRWRLSAVRAAIRDGSISSLRQLINMDYSRFSGTHYAQSWSLIYFLVNTPGGKERFDAFWQGLKDGNKNQTRLFERIFDKPMGKIDAAWKRYVMKLR